MPDLMSENQRTQPTRFDLVDSIYAVIQQAYDLLKAEPVNYPSDPVEAAGLLSILIFVQARETYEGLLKGVEGLEVSKGEVQNRMHTIIFESECLLLHITDRIADERLSPAQRARLLDFLMPTTINATVDALMSHPDPRMVEEFKQAAIEELNARSIEYMKYRAVFPPKNRGESLGGTLLYEFAKRIGRLLGTQDPALIIPLMLGMMGRVMGLGLGEAMKPWA